MCRMQHQWMQNQKALAEGQGSREILPALTWLSLVGLLLSSAQLRFTRRDHGTQVKPQSNSKKGAA